MPPPSTWMEGRRHDGWVRRLESELRGKLQLGSLKAGMATVREKTLAEVSRGLAAGPFSKAQLDSAYGVGSWRPMQRFSVLHKNKVRPCDNARQSGSNEGTSTYEKLRCEKADFPARVARAFARLSEEIDHPFLPLRGGTDDLADAYRHVPCADPRFTVVAVPNPRSREIEYFTMSGFNFGLKSAVLCFNRFPECVTAVARQVLAVVCSHYYDDFVVVEPAQTVQGGQEALRELMKLLGFPFSAEKAVDATKRFTFLGVVSDLTSAEEGGVVLSVSESRRARLVAHIDNILAKGSVGGAQAASLCGKLQFTLTWAFGRVGRAGMQPLHGLDARGGGELTDVSQAALEFFRELLPSLPPCYVSLSSRPAPPNPSVVGRGLRGQGRAPRRRVPCAGASPGGPPVGTLRAEREGLYQEVLRGSPRVRPGARTPPPSVCADQTEDQPNRAGRGPIMPLPLPAPPA